MSIRAAFVPLCLLVQWGCAAEHSEPSIEPSIEPAATAASAESHRDSIASIARDYKTWRLADDEFYWAPWLCRNPLRGGEHISRASRAAHGSKLFRLWAYDIGAYGIAAGWTEHAEPSITLERSPAPPPPGIKQVLVKESFEALPFDPAAPPVRVNDDALGEFGLHGAHLDGKTFVPGEPIGLFVMMQFETPRAGTDEGWIYGTVAPDGSVTSASDSGACRDCHASRPNRVFGLPRRPG